MKAEDYIQGDEIIYLPGHADGNIDHPDCERGFVTSIRNGTVFCRFFAKNGHSDFYGLRTVANSEGCNPVDLRFIHNATQRTKIILEVMQKSPDIYGYIPAQ